MMKITLLLFCLPGYLASYGQKDSLKISGIDQYVFQVNSVESSFRSIQVIMDSIKADIKCYPDKIESINFFGKSQSVVTITLYTRGCELLLASIKEQSPKYDDLFAASVFYLEHDSIFFSKYYYAVRSCMGIPLNRSFYDLYGYNPALNSDFLKKYVRELYSRAKHEENIIPSTAVRPVSFY